MKSINLENLKRLKKALQRKKIKRIDSFRVQIGRCDYNLEGNDGVPQEIFRENENHEWLWFSKENNSWHKLNLVSSTAVNEIEVRTICKGTQESGLTTD